MITQDGSQTACPLVDPVPDHPARKGPSERSKTLHELVASAQVAGDDQTTAHDVGARPPDAMDPSHLPGGVRNNVL